MEFLFNIVVPILFFWFIVRSIYKDFSKQKTKKQNEKAEADALRYYDIGIDYIFRKDYRQAINYFTWAINKLPNQGVIWYLRGFCREKLNDNKAKEDYSMANQLSFRLDDYVLFNSTVYFNKFVIEDNLQRILVEKDK